MIEDANPFETGHLAGREKYRKGKDTVNPCKPGFDDWEIWYIGYTDGFSQAEAQDKGDDYGEDDYEEDDSHA
jgi:hypothetical protein